MKPYQQYVEAVRRKVCDHCIDQAETGRCTLSGSDPCGVEIYLPDIIDVVHMVRSSELSDYVAVLRKRICLKCRNQNPNGFCQLRNEANCALDRYFALVIQAIEEIDQLP